MRQHQGACGATRRTSTGRCPGLGGHWRSGPGWPWLLATVIVAAVVFSGQSALAADLTSNDVSGQAYASDLIDSQADALGLSQLEKEIANLTSSYADVSQKIGISDWLRTSKVGESLDPLGILKGILSYLLREVTGNLFLLGQLISLVVLAAIARNLSASMDDDTVGSITSMVLYMMILLVGLGSFRSAAGVAISAIDSMVTFVQSLLPTLFALMTAMGGVSSAALLHPVILMVVTGFSTLVRGVVVPMVLFSTVLAVATRVSDRVKVKRLASVLRQAATTMMTFLFGTFLTVMSLRGAVGAFGDALTMKTAKFAAGTFVPVVGRVFADALEVVAGTSLLIKNTVGVAGVVALMIATVFPALKIAALVVMFRLASGLVQPLGDDKAADCLGDLADSLGYLAFCVAATGVMFSVSIGIVVGIGAIPQMLR